MEIWINNLFRDGALPQEGYRELLQGGADDALREAAREVTHREFGNKIYVRALLEVTNRCRNNCYYCGIRAANRELRRYSLSQESILECCRAAYKLGFRTFVLQGGEDPEMSDEWVEQTVQKIRDEFLECAITLSLGERSRACYERWFKAGANRYLLRHESYNEEHYASLHPRVMSRDRRIESLRDLRDIGFQVGTGIMVGSPAQTIEHIVEDLKFIEEFRPEMVGIGPFLPHHATPFGGAEAGSLEMTLRLISILRLMHPAALIPSTTALATLDPMGRELGIEAGANIVMPNVSPVEERKSYSLYDNKAAFGSESAEGLLLLTERLSKIGYEISFERGDYVPKKRQ